LKTNHLATLLAMQFRQLAERKMGFAKINHFWIEKCEEIQLHNTSLVNSKQFFKMIKSFVGELFVYV
jgi:hypothetical protein